MEFIWIRIFKLPPFWNKVSDDINQGTGLRLWPLPSEFQANQFTKTVFIYSYFFNGHHIARIELRLFVRFRLCCQFCDFWRNSFRVFIRSEHYRMFRITTGVYGTNGSCTETHERILIHFRQYKKKRKEN